MLNRSAEKRTRTRSVIAVFLPKLISMFLSGSPQIGWLRPSRVSALSSTGRKSAYAAHGFENRFRPVPFEVPIPLHPVELLFIPAEGTPLSGIMALFEPSVIASPQACALSVTQTGGPEKTETRPDVYQPPITRSNQVPVLNLCPLPTGRS